MVISQELNKSFSKMLFVVLILIIALLRSAESFSNVKFLFDGRNSLQKINIHNKLEASISSRPETTTASSSTIISVDGNQNIPFLPPLTLADLRILHEGGRVQKQARSGRTGSGLVVVDVKAPLQDVFELLQRVDEYDKYIPTVRSVTAYSKSNDKLIKAEFSLSRFNLKVNVVHEKFPSKRLVKFSLDADKPNLVLKKAGGFWYVEDAADRPGYTRVYLSASVACSVFVPTLIVDYAAARALPRATSWLRPFFEKTPYIPDEGC